MNRTKIVAIGSGGYDRGIRYRQDREMVTGIAPRRLARFATSVRACLTGQRVLFVLVICTVTSTQVFFQPQLYEAFSIEQVLLGWFDYLGECLLMGLPIMMALTVAEVALDGLPRFASVVVVVAALLVGATLGRLLVVPYYDLGWQHLPDRAFWGDVIYWVAIGGGLATIYGLQRRAASAAAALHQAKVDQLALSRQMLEARLQVLRAQIEPHFLFNTLANVKRLCRADVDGGLRMLSNLVHYLQAALPRMRESQTTLAEEAELVRAYLAILQIRMGPRLRFRIEIPGELRAQPFPPMILLTLAENAVRHGLSPSPYGGMISVRARAAGPTLEVSMADSGVGFRAAAGGGTGVGLANTRARLAALYGDSARLDLEPNEPSGVTAVIRLPLAAWTPARGAAAFPA